MKAQLTLSRPVRGRRLQAALVAGVVAVVGVTVLLFTRAAGPLAAFEAESGSVSAPAMVMNASGASGGQLVRFQDPNMPWAHSPLPGGARHTATPTITLDQSAAPELTSWMVSTIKPLMLSWYPVIGDFFAYPSYTPPAAITVRADPTYDGVMYADGTTIVYSSTWVSANKPESAGAFLHEATHVIQQSQNLPSWLVEGGADYTREHIYNDRPPRNIYDDETYYSGYSAAANFMDAGETAAPGFIAAVTAAGHAGTYSDALIPQLTGKTFEQLWKQGSGKTITPNGPLVNVGSGKCIDLPNYETADGTRMQLLTCYGPEAQKWLVQDYDTATGGIIRGWGGKCLDIQFAGTTSGTPVQYQGCDAGGAQRWVYRADKTLYNPMSQKCLRPVNGAATDNTKLEIANCSASNSQKWTLPQ